MFISMVRNLYERRVTLVVERSQSIFVQTIEVECLDENDNYAVSFINESCGLFQIVCNTILFIVYSTLMLCPLSECCSPSVNTSKHYSG